MTLAPQCVFGGTGLHFQDDTDARTNTERLTNFFETYCLDCHTGDDAERGFKIDTLDFTKAKFLNADFDPQAYEAILKRLEARQMPPVDAHRPGEAEYQTIGQLLAERLDHRPIRTTPIPSIRRLTRLEYENSVRDLLGIKISGSQMLPADPSSHGFDNITVTELSPLLLDRYVKAAEQIAQLAVAANDQPIGRTVRLPADQSQEQHVAGLPFGTRGGTQFLHRFTRSGVYEFEMKLTRDRDEKVEGLNRKHDLDLILDRKLIKRFELIPPKAGNWENRDFSKSDAHLRIRVPIDAGEHEVCVTFPCTSSSLVEDKRKPFDANFNRHRHPRKTPALYQVSIVGPLSEQPVDGASNQPNDNSQKRLWGEPILATADARRVVAERLLRKLARRAFRRPLQVVDIKKMMAFYDQSIRDANSDSIPAFYQAMELSLASILVHPSFLFRLESESVGTSQLTPDLRLASRLSFFIWSSLPDEELLQLAEANKLSNVDILSAQIERMLRDTRAESLVKNFADQWLYLRNLESITPDLRRFPDFDNNLRQAFRQETQHLFRDVLRNDRSVLTLIHSDHTYLNERLATHYDIPGVRGDHFRKVKLDGKTPRGGLLRQGSVLMVTSYATRTSPTIRGNWILENILGLPAPPPPPNVPNLKERTMLDAKTIRERLEQHRADPACASCHDLMDPIGFALENFDAVGRWRDLDDESPVDAAGTYFDGSTISSVVDLERKIANNPRRFVKTLTEKLMTFALGRMVDQQDQPSIRKIARDAKEADFRFSAIVKGIVLSQPFQNSAR